VASPRINEGKNANNAINKAKSNQERKRKMKTNRMRVCILSAAAGLVLVSGSALDANGQVVFRVPGITIALPVVVTPVMIAPPVAPVMVPDSYVWDGSETVGLVGDRYFYLGPDHVWLGCEPYRLGRFHAWERDHRDWRLHAIHNVDFRPGGRGYGSPGRDRGPRDPRKEAKKH
jgi:hypothetical protein